LRVVVSGAGAAGVACTKILLEAGIGDVAIADSKGLLHEGRSGMTAIKMEMAGLTNKVGLVGSIEEALNGADVYIGVSAGEVVGDDLADDCVIPSVFDKRVGPAVAAAVAEAARVDGVARL